ncbi:MAG TPA: POTRA domain-containing protein [Bryobacteraceae bacterium]|nr:POTRA domain-containing protein [Bryobacteraceae bacterium]
MKRSIPVARNNFMRLLAILVLAMSMTIGMPVVSAQQQKKRAPGPAGAEFPEPFPLQNLAIEGNQRIATEKIANVSGLRIGAPVLKSDFDHARIRLMATGAFESVSYQFKPSADNKGYDGTLEVVEVDQIYPYRFEDLPPSDDALRAAIRKQEFLLGDQIPATKEVIDRYVAALQNVVGDKITVVGKLNSDIPGRLMIVFRPNIPRPAVAEVRFTGNQVLPTALLTRTLGEAAIGTAFSDVTMRALLDSSIRPLYEARGRLRVAFPKIEATPAPLIDGVIVKMTVEEGESYSLGDVKFSGVPAADWKDLERAANLQSKDIANFDDVKAGMDRVEHRYQTKGYLHVKTRADRDVNDQAHTVGLTIHIDLGAQYLMGKLDIAGLDINSEPVIRKMWGIKPGAPFEAGYPDAFFKEIRDQEIFDNLGKTRSETNVDEKSHTVNVKLFFTGEPPGQKKRGSGN